MFADTNPGWGVLQSGITAAAGLGGVCAGALLTARNQKAERRNARIREQLQDFYSPLLVIFTSACQFISLPTRGAWIETMLPCEVKR